MNFYDDLELLIDDIELTIKAQEEVDIDTIYRIVEVLKLLVVSLNN
jgi:hypothetical protein